jgi:hypothetical protein
MWDLSAPATVSERVVLRRLPASDPITPGPLNDVSDVDGVLMFPCPDDEPSGLTEAFLRPAVPRDVGVELGPPPVGVRLRGDGVIGAAVPEAAVDEDGDPGTGESNVGPAGKGPEVDAVAETTAMQLPAKGEFRLGARRPQRRHEATDRMTRRRGFVRNR